MGKQEDEEEKNDNVDAGKVGEHKYEFNSNKREKPENCVAYLEG